MGFQQAHDVVDVDASAYAFIWYNSLVALADVGLLVDELLVA
jgi:hypothetical protein